MSAIVFEYHNVVLSAVWGSSTEVHVVREVFISSVWIKHMIAISCATYKFLILHESLSGIDNKVSAVKPAHIQLQKSSMSASLPLKWNSVHWGIRSEK